MNHTSRQPDRLRIWQQNAHKSRLAQEHILNTANPGDWDLILLQEPWFDTYGNSRGNQSFHVIYPSTFLSDKDSPTRSIILINSNINKDCYTELAIPSNDITAVRLTIGDRHFSLFNIYNDCNHNRTLDTLNSYLADNLQIALPQPEDHMFWFGDFNRHHPCWEDEANARTYNSENFIAPLLDLIHDHGMIMALPPSIPTLRNSAGNWTHPDNVWQTESTLDLVISCDTCSTLRPPNCDHLPIITTLDVSPPRTTSKPRFNFRDVSWNDFQTDLQHRLALIPPPSHITTEEQFNDAVTVLSTCLRDTVVAQVPTSEPSRYTKRWWSRELSILRKRRNKASCQSFRFRDIPEHPSHRELQELSDEYTSCIEKMKKDHWELWLETISASAVFKANRYATDSPSDYSKTRIPSLKHTIPDLTLPSPAQLNSDKSKVLANTFFPPPPSDPLIPDFVYPKPLKGVRYFTRKQIRCTVCNLSPYKAPGPDTIPNIVLMRTIDLINERLFFIYRASLEFGWYHSEWRTSTTLVLRKPGRPTYDIAKSYRPIGLLNTIGKLLSTLIAADLSFLVEKHHLLPAHQFGGRPGRTTTDAIHLLTAKVKDAWRKGQVATALFLDVQAAFPNTVKSRLLHNLQCTRVPTAYVRLAEAMLTNRQTLLAFDDFVSTNPILIINGTTQGCPLSMIYYSFYNAPLIDSAQLRNETVIGFVDDCTLLVTGNTLDDTHRSIREMMERDGGCFDWSISHNSPFELTKFAAIDFARRNTQPPSQPLVITKTNRDGTRTSQIILPTPHHRFLGVLIDAKLR